MFCWESVSASIEINSTLTRSTHLNIVRDHPHPLPGNSRVMWSEMLYKVLKNGETQMRLNKADCFLDAWCCAMMPNAADKKNGWRGNYPCTYYEHSS